VVHLYIYKKTKQYNAAYQLNNDPDLLFVFPSQFNMGAQFKEYEIELLVEITGKYKINR